MRQRRSEDTEGQSLPRRLRQAATAQEEAGDQPDEMTGPARCAWARTRARIPYHDAEWGVPVHDDRVLFEFLILEGAQAGLSWETILTKRDALPRGVRRFRSARRSRASPPRKIDRLLRDPGHRSQPPEGRVRRVATPALPRGAASEFGSFDAYVWGFVGGTSAVNRWRAVSQVPARTPESDALSKDLRRAASSSSARPSATPSCRRSAWSTTTPSTVSGTRS